MNSQDIFKDIKTDFETDELPKYIQEMISDYDSYSDVLALKIFNELFQHINDTKEFDMTRSFLITRTTTCNTFNDIVILYNEFFEIFRKAGDTTRKFLVKVLIDDELIKKISEKITNDDNAEKFATEFFSIFYMHFKTEIRNSELISSNIDVITNFELLNYLQKYSQYAKNEYVLIFNSLLKLAYSETTLPIRPKTENYNKIIASIPLISDRLMLMSIVYYFIENDIDKKTKSLFTTFTRANKGFLIEDIIGAIFPLGVFIPCLHGYFNETFNKLGFLQKPNETNNTLTFNYENNEIIIKNYVYVFMVTRKSNLEVSIESIVRFSNDDEATSKTVINWNNFIDIDLFEVFFSRDRIYDQTNEYLKFNYKINGEIITGLLAKAPKSNVSSYTKINNITESAEFNKLCTHFLSAYEKTRLSIKEGTYLLQDSLSNKKTEPFPQTKKENKSSGFKLLFISVNNHKILGSKKISLDSTHRIEYTNNRLTIETSKQIKDFFFRNDDYYINFSVILGKNGSGKTTLLSYLKNMDSILKLVNEDKSNFAIFEKDNMIYCICDENNEKIANMIIQCDIPVELLRNVGSTEYFDSIFYSASFNPLSIKNDKKISSSYSKDISYIGNAFDENYNLIKIQENENDLKFLLLLLEKKDFLLKETKLKLNIDEINLQIIYNNEDKITINAYFSDRFNENDSFKKFIIWLSGTEIYVVKENNFIIDKILQLLDGTNNPVYVTTLLYALIFQNERIERFFEYELKKPHYSTGESNLILFYSRLNAISYFSNEDNTSFFTTNDLFPYLSETCQLKNDTVFLFIDEVDLYLHPEWQRTFINKLLIFLKETKIGTEKLHIFVTSHSPIIISDFPKENIVVLDESEEKILSENTFAQNISTLYRKIFSVERALFGEFAFNKVTEATKNTASHELIDYIVEVIGDPIVKSALNSKHSKIINSNMKKKFEELEKRISELENK